MPSISVHLKVGYLLSEKLKTNSYEYYLGLIAPDSPNLNGFAPKKERWEAHKRSANLKEWRTNLKKFYHAEKKNYPQDFLLGYYLHILTDIVYDDFFYNRIKEKIIKNGAEKENIHEIMSKDLYNYDFSEYKLIKKILNSKEVSFEINNISKELLINYKNKIINTENKSEKSIYTTEKLILDLTEQVYKEILEDNI